MTTFLPAGGRVGGLGGYATITQVQLDKPESHERPPVHVGVVDTGLVLRDGEPHPWLLGRVEFDPVADADQVSEDDPSGSRSHGTFVSGLILNEAATALVHMRGALDKSTGTAEDLAVANAIYEMASTGVQLVNLSFCGDAWEVGTPSVIAKAITALGHDAVVVAAAGNLGSSRPFYPGGMPSPDKGPEIVAVGALVGKDEPRVAAFSNYGETVRFYADGENLLGPYGANEWAYWSGTSFASAVLTGKIADYLSRHQDNTPRTALGHIRETADSVDVYGVNGRALVPFVRAKG